MSSKFLTTLPAHDSMNIVPRHKFETYIIMYVYVFLKFKCDYAEPCSLLGLLLQKHKLFLS